MPLLEGKHRWRPRPQRKNRVAGGIGRGERSRVGNVIRNRRLTHRVVVPLRFLAQRSVDHQFDLAIQHQIDAVRAAFVDLEQSLGRNSARPQILGRPRRRDQSESHLVEPARDRGHAALV